MSSFGAVLKIIISLVYILKKQYVYHTSPIMHLISQAINQLNVTRIFKCGTFASIKANFGHFSLQKSIESKESLFGAECVIRKKRYFEISEFELHGPECIHILDFIM